MRGLIAEFEQQSFTQIIFPHKNSDWNEYLQLAESTFINIINQIIKYQKCLVVCDNIYRVKANFEENNNLFFVEYQTNDTWARDSSALSVQNSNKIEILDFQFNAWGSKFEYEKDNNMSNNISHKYSKNLTNVDFILEGGAVESNGDGIILTTSDCLFNKNRNRNLTNQEITSKLLKFLNSKEILYLNHGYLVGDDTDSHIDTLARFINKESIMYVGCDNINDEHYQELKLMENELKSLIDSHNFKLIKLPFPDSVYYKEDRLPATYANFLFINNAVLVPTYNVKEDDIALKIFTETFTDRDIIPIDCSILIRQHGSLHCVTMNFATGIELKS